MCMYVCIYVCMYVCMYVLFVTTVIMQGIKFQPSIQGVRQYHSSRAVLGLISTCGIPQASINAFELVSFGHLDFR